MTYIHSMFKDWKNGGRFKGLEILFFFLIFFLFPILTDIEFRVNEQPCQSCDNRFSIAILERLISGFFSIWPWLFFYYFILNRFLLTKKYRLFIVTTILFFIALEFYTVYVYYWTVSHMEFLPESILRSYRRYYQSLPFFHFSVVYVITRMLIFMSLAYYIKSNKQEQYLRIIQNQKLEADLRYLKAQMEPHFFFNTLNNLYSLALQGSAETAPLVARLSDLMRYVIYEAKKDLVPVEKEVEFIKNYIAVHAIRYRTGIDIKLEVENFPTRYLIQPMLLMPFFENAFKHGLEEEVEKGFIKGLITLQGSQLILELKNSLPGVRQNLSSENGIGLDNSRKRLDLLYPGKHDLQISSDDKVYSVFLKLTLGN